MKKSCFNCMYFHITWDPDRPRGCKAYGFKTKQIPSVLVKKSSGGECLAFKPKKKAKKSEIDFNDNDLW